MHLLCYLVVLAAAAPPTVVHFDSGLRVALLPDADARRVALSTVVGAGLVDDPAGAEGVAHLAEHLWFRASHDGEAVWDVHRRLGCASGAWTYQDRTLYSTDCPPDALDALVAMEALRLRDPVAGATDEVVQVESAVLGHEETGRRRNPFVQVLPEVHRALYRDDHPVNEREDRARYRFGHLDLGAVQAFTKEHYAPENTTIAISGPFDPDTALQLLHQTFGPADSPRSPRAVRVRPPPRRTLRVAPREGVIDLEHPVVAVAWDLPTTDLLTVAVLEDLLSTRMNALTVGSPDVLGAHCQVTFDALSAPMVCMIETTNEADLDALGAWVRSGLVGMWTGRSGREVKKSFGPLESRVRIGLAADRQRVGFGRAGRTTQVAAWVYYGGEGDPWARALDALDTTRPNDVLELARTWLAPESASVLLLRAESSETSTPVQVPEPLEPGPPPAEATGTGTRAVAAGRILNNGLRVLAISRPDLEVTHAAARVRRAVHPADGLSELLDLIVLPKTPDSQRPVEVFHSTSPTGPIHGTIGGSPDEALEQLADSLMTRSVVYPLTPIAMQRTAIRNAEKAERADHWARAMVRSAFLPEPESVLSAMGVRMAEITLLPPQELAQALGMGAAHRYSPSNTELAVIGPDSHETLLAAAERHLGSWAAPPTTLPGALAVRLPEPAVHVVEDPFVDESAVLLTCPLATDEPVAHHLLEKVILHQLVDRVRSQRGANYTPSVSVERGGDKPLLHLAVSTAPAAAGAVLREMRQAIEAVDVGLSSESLSRARNTLRATSDPGSRPAGEVMGGVFRYPSMSTAEQITGWSEAVDTTGAAQLTALTATCLPHAVIGISGPVEPVTAGLAGDRGEDDPVGEGDSEGEAEPEGIDSGIAYEVRTPIEVAESLEALVRASTSED